MRFGWNLYKDRPAFIFAAGPSINDLAFGLFDSQITFGVQRLCNNPRFPEPLYWGVTEGRDYQHYVWERLSKENSSIFLNRERGDIPPSLDSSRVYLMSQLPDTKLDSIGTPEVSMGFLSGFWSSLKSYRQMGCSVLQGCVQPAIWLGCNPIYILGLDLSDSYFDGHPVGQPARPNMAWWDRINKALEFTRNEMHARGREIYNLSPNTNDTILPKMRLEEALERGGVARAVR